MVLTALAFTGCVFDMPGLGCDLVIERALVAPESNECTRYFVAEGGTDACLRLADSDDCTCEAELVVPAGTRVVFALDRFADSGRADWEPAECPDAQPETVEK